MDASAFEAQCREILERHTAQLISELSVPFHTSLQSAVGEAERRNRLAIRRETAETLNQIVRMLRQASNRQDAFSVLADSSAAYCDKAAVFAVNGETCEAIHTRGFPAGLHIPLSGAPAFRTALETRDPVVAASTAGEISDSLAEPLAGPAAPVYLFPIVVRHRVTALLFAAGEAQPAALEILSEVAGLQLEALSGDRPAQKGALIGIEPAPEPGRSAWEDLSPDDQALHLRAQRYARVRVAELRLYRAEAVREGRNGGDLYGALRGDIDAVREVFLRDFVRASPTMVDYFHLEILRGLAHEDDRLLGPEYPGPLV